MGSARRLASRRAGPWAPLAGSLRAGQARGLRSQARFAQGRRRRISFSLRAPELRILRKLRMTRDSYWEHLPSAGQRFS